MNLTIHTAEYNTLVDILVVSIILLKILWIRTEIHYFKKRVNFSMFKTNALEALILFLQLAVVYMIPIPFPQYEYAFMIIGTGMLVIGFIFALMGRATMKKSWGIPGEHHTQQDELVTSGIFSISRNPIYVGFFLIYTGFCVAIQSWLIILRLPLFIYFYKSAVTEEKLLEKTFGEKYVNYKKRVPRFLLGF